jgi:hypothetical protein
VAGDLEPSHADSPLHYLIHNGQVPGVPYEKGQPIDRWSITPIRNPVAGGVVVPREKSGLDLGNDCVVAGDSPDPLSGEQASTRQETR